MRALRRVELYLMEDIYTPEGTLESRYIPHNFSVDQAIGIVSEMLKALNILLSPDEMKDLSATLEKASHGLGKSRGTEPDHPLKIHEV
jgi:hypothetical protein